MNDTPKPAAAAIDRDITVTVIARFPMHPYDLHCERDYMARIVADVLRGMTRDNTAPDVTIEGSAPQEIDRDAMTAAIMIDDAETARAQLATYKAHRTTTTTAHGVQLVHWQARNAEGSHCLHAHPNQLTAQRCADRLNEPPRVNVPMTERQRYALINALYTAAATYDTDSANPQLPQRLREQFAKQSMDARELANQLANDQL